MNIDKIDLDERIKYFENHLDEAQIIMTASLEQFIKTFHYIRKNEEFQIKDFHLQVIAELEELVFGKQKNLLIEMPPRAGKSDMIDYFICWTYIINPNCNYIVTCYNDDLVGKFSKTMRSIIESDLYQKVFKLRMSSDTHSVGLWKIKDGGELRAISINGGITGFGAGIKGERYGGALCFAYDTLVWTDKGRIKIGDIVTKKLNVKVLSYNTQTKEFSFKEITQYHDNGIAETIEFCGMRCTKDHRFFTKDGWKKAQDISSVDVLFGFSYPFYLMKRYTKFFSNIFSFVSCIKNKVKIFCREMFVSPFMIRNRIIFQMFKIFPLFNCNNSSIIDIIEFSNFTNSSVISKNRDDLFISKRSMTSTQTTTSNSILHIIGFSSVSKIFKFIVRWIIIQMSNFHTFFLNTYKSTKNKLMNSEFFYFSIFTKTKIFITFVSNIFYKFFRAKIFSSIFSYYNSLNAFYSSKIRNLIKSFIVRDIFPYFNHKNTTKENVYCLTIQDNHTFFVGKCQTGVLSHNCIDDPLKAVDAKSEVKRKSVIDAYTNTLKSRLNNLDLTPTIVIMQRLHKQDLAGYLENEIKEGRLKNWKIIKVKAIKEDGTSFWEESYSLKSLEDMRVQHPYTFYSQYQQEPINESTSKFKDTMFEEVGMPDDFDYLYIIADTTYKDGQDNDYTVFSCFGVKDKKLYLIDIIRQKIQAVDIEKWCIPFIKKNTRYGFEGCYIEPKGHGIYLNQSLPKQNIMMPSEDDIAEFFKDRKVGKVERANAIMPFFTNNKLYINRDIEKGMKNDIIGECISFPDGEHDDVCLAGNTLISTIKGKIPIKDIKIGDWLITPLGLSKVERCGKTGHKYIIKKYGIEATENHKIFDKSLHKFREIKYDVLVDNISYGGLIKWKYQKLLYLMENGMLLWGRKGIIFAHQQRIEAESVLRDFIRLFGNFITNGKFLKGMLFITKMATLLTTTSLIWSVYQINNILKSTKKSLLNEIKPKSILNIFRKSETLQKSGIEAKKEKNGIVKMQKDILKKYQKKSSAQIAEGDLEKCLQVNQTNTEIQSAENVMTNITKEKKEEKIDVYNITTKAGCYYANDILVSNCDTIIDGVKKYLLKEMINDEDGW